MRVLQIGYSDLGGGGAALAMWRLHEGLRAADVQSRALVGTATSGSPDVATIPITFSERVGELIFRKFGYRDETFRSASAVRCHPWHADIDILHLHNLHSFYFNHRHLPEIARGKAVVWTLHDMWAVTGHCAYSFECDRWERGCGRCPHLDTYPAIPRDTTARVWKRREAVYARLAREARSVAVVAPSRWLAEVARRGLLGRFPVHHLPYGLDLGAYRPLDRTECRSLLGLPQDKLALLCVSADMVSPFKGIRYLLDALPHLPESVATNAELWIMGNGAEGMVAASPIPARSLGYNTGDRVKAMIFSAADLFVLPSRADNLPLVLQEALACGLPAVGFAVGGVPDLIRHGETGLLAEPENPADLAAKIAELLPDAPRRATMSTRSRQVAEADYDIRDITRKYIDLYQALLA